MGQYIEKVSINEFDGLFNQEIRFTNGLNIISGENGTGKTKLLTTLKTAAALLAANTEGKDNATQIRTFALSPKRNAERKSYENAYAQIKRENRGRAQWIAEIQGRQIQDNGFENYHSFVELFAYYYDEKISAGDKTPIDVTKEIETEFNEVLQRLFTEYSISAQWNAESGNTTIKIKKNGIELNVERLSLGEQEIFSLIFNIFVSRDTQDVYLIDEPEIHLNWSLEHRLFTFFNWFCETYDKQIIVVTHSRAIFGEDFYDKAQFLVWEDGKIVPKKEINEKQRAAIAGEAISLMRMVKLGKKTFFVEDKAHNELLGRLIMKVNGSENIDIVPLGKKDLVVSMFKFSRSSAGEWDLASFIIDGDNEGEKFPGEANFIQLSRYCIENYLFDIPTMVTISGRSVVEITSLILEAIKEKKKDILLKNKYLDFLLDRLTQADITVDFLSKLDCSEIFESVLSKLGMTRTNYLDAYFTQVDIETMFDTKLVESIKTPVSTEVTELVIEVAEEMEGNK